VPTTNGPDWPAIVNAEIDKAPPSMSEAFASRPAAAGTVSVASSLTEFVSLPSTGASLTAVTLSVTVVVSVTPPEVTV